MSSESLQSCVVSDLSLGCDPDGQGAIVPPLVLELALVVRQHLGGGGVEPHVVNHSMVLHIETWETREKNSITLIVRNYMWKP